MTLDKNSPKRLVSLDAFRGFTIVAMLMVNNPGYDSAFPDQLRHAPWGKMVTFCDMIFPWFLFIVGVAIPFSAASFFSKNASFPKYALKAFKRMLMLIFFGVMIDCSIQKKIHVGMNVLQLIGLAYFCGAMLYELPKKFRIVVAGFFLLIHWAIIMFVPIPGIGAGFFEENKNIVNYVNQILRPYYLAGILSVIPTAALVLIGTMFGDLLRDEKSSQIKKIKIMLLSGVILSIAGLLWHIGLPMSKHVWTSSYILFSSGMGALVFVLFYFILDIKGIQKWAMPFIVFGMNAITAYFFSIMVRVHTVQEWFTESANGAKATLWTAMLNFWTNLAGINVGSYLFTFSYITFWGLVMYWMYRKKLFLRV